jgi:L-seryl-tRNA(Ser) seleniumtransferase
MQLVNERSLSMAAANEKLLRNIPSVEVLLQDPRIKKLAGEVPRRLVVESVRAAVDETRHRLLDAPPADVSEASLRKEILARAEQHLALFTRSHYRKVVNATGIILHTGLGRAVLASKALRQIQEELSGYSLLQLETEGGKRSKRDERIEWLLKLLTGAEAATVVNNNAAATMLVLSTVARGREVIVSRGQLVEIGGSFRLPEVMAASGAKLVEVGTTNKTHLKDYVNAVTENTAAILRVHPSNYKIVGFTSEVPLEELVAAAHARGLTLIDDVGAGALIDFSRFGFQKEPTLQESVAAGADLVLSSADKLIGASQGGIILGKADRIDAIRKNPIARMVRVGKLTLSVLEATLMLVLDESMALREVPTLRMLTRDLAEIAQEAERIAAAVRSRVPAASVSTTDGASQMGSGSLPEQNLPTRLVVVESKSMTPDALALALRNRPTPVFARIQNDLVLLDPRTLLEGDENLLVDALVESLKTTGCR